jgi:hypothetical protein
VGSAAYEKGREGRDHHATPPIERLLVVLGVVAPSDRKAALTRTYASGQMVLVLRWSSMLWRLPSAFVRRRRPSLGLSAQISASPCLGV